MPKTIDKAGPIIVAGIRADGKRLPLRGPSATSFPSQRPDLLQILQAPCSSAFILDYSPKEEELIEGILAGGSGKQYKTYVAEQWKKKSAIEAEKLKNQFAKEHELSSAGSADQGFSTPGLAAEQAQAVANAEIESEKSDASKTKAADEDRSKDLALGAGIFLIAAIGGFSLWRRRQSNRGVVKL